MQIITTTTTSVDFFSPTTGKHLIGSEGLKEPCESLLGVWTEDLPHEPEFISPRIKKAWEHTWNYFQANGQPGVFKLENFFSQIDAPNCAVFEITIEGVACGPVSSTFYVMVDLA